MPARVDDTDAFVEIEPEWPGLEPLDLLGSLFRRELTEELLVLFLVLVVVLAHEVVRVRWVFAGVGDGVELVIAHDDLSGASLLHPSDDLQDINVLLASVNQVTDEDRLAVGVPVDALRLYVAEAMEESDQFLALAVHIADDVVATHVTSVSLGRDADSVRAAIQSHKLKKLVFGHQSRRRAPLVVERMLRPVRESALRRD